MKKNKMLKKFGDVLVTLMSITTYNTIQFQGTNEDGRTLLVNLSGDFDDLPFTIYINNNFPVIYLCKHFTKFTKTIMVGSSDDLLNVYCTFPPKKS